MTDARSGMLVTTILLMVATDRREYSTMQITKVSCKDVESIEKSMGGLVKENNVIGSDAYPSIMA